jgi:hypothetical protein
MLDTAVALVFAHVLADFALQTDGMVRNKRKPQVLLAHVAIVAAVSWAALGFAPAWALIALITVSHLAIDTLKLSWGNEGFRAFALDQAAHLGAIAIGVALFPAAYAAGIWAAPTFAPLPGVARLPETMVLVAGLVATVWAGGYAVGALMTNVQKPANPESLPSGGRLIGKLERLLILILVLAGEAGGIGFLIAAKSILRFNELAGEADRHVSEYVIIGTLASFAWALATGYATLVAFQALAP